MENQFHFHALFKLETAGLQRSWSNLLIFAPYRLKQIHRWFSESTLSSISLPRPEFELRIHNSFLGLHVDIELGGGRVWAALKVCLETSVALVSQAIDALSTVQQPVQTRKSEVVECPQAALEPQKDEVRQIEVSHVFAPEAELNNTTAAASTEKVAHEPENTQN